MADEVGASPLQVVLAWMIQGSPPMVPLITGSSREQMEENLGCLDVELTADMIETLTGAGDQNEAGDGHLRERAAALQTRR